MQPIREDRNRDVAVDWTMREHPFAQNDEGHFLSDPGGIASMRKGRKFVQSCGCVNNPIAGFCGECSQPVCTDCFGFCCGSHCHKPLCPRHSVFVRDRSGAMLRYCTDCFRRVSRKQTLGTIVRFVLSPFVSFGKHHEER